MYTVDSNTATTGSLGKFPSVVAALRAVEQEFQCNAIDSIKEVRASMRSRGSAFLTSCLDGTTNCTIRRTA